MPFPTALIIGPVLDIAKSVLNRVLPAEKMTESERVNLEQQLTIALMQQDWKEVEAEYTDRADARALAKADVEKGNAFSNILAAVVRPTWGLGAFLLVTYAILADVPISPFFNDIIQTLLMFYFGGRTIEKVMPMLVTGYQAKQTALVDVESEKTTQETIKKAPIIVSGTIQS